MDFECGFTDFTNQLGAPFPVVEIDKLMRSLAARATDDFRHGQLARLRLNGLKRFVMNGFVFFQYLLVVFLFFFLGATLRGGLGSTSNFR